MILKTNYHLKARLIHNWISLATSEEPHGSYDKGRWQLAGQFKIPPESWDEVRIFWLKYAFVLWTHWAWGIQVFRDMVWFWWCKVRVYFKCGHLWFATQIWRLRESDPNVNMSSKPEIWSSIPDTHGRVRLTLTKDVSTTQEEPPLKTNPSQQTLESDIQET